MGCRTGNYLLLAGDYESADIVPLMTEMFEFIRDFEGEIPGASAKDCGKLPGIESRHGKIPRWTNISTMFLYDIRPVVLFYPEII